MKSSTKNKGKQALNIFLSKNPESNHKKGPFLLGHLDALSTTTNPGSIIYSRYSNPHQEHIATLTQQLSNLQQYQKYYLNLMHFQRNKYTQYFNEIFCIIHFEYSLGLQQIQSYTANIIHEFQYKKNQLINSITELWSRKGKKDRGDKDIQRVQEGGFFGVEWVEIQMGDLEGFRREVKKYTSLGLLKREEQNEPVKDNTCANKIQITVSDKSTQTDLVELQDPKSPSPKDQFDDMLSCDEELGADRNFKLSASSRRRRKYAVGRRDVIRQEDEFSESSSIVSQS